VLAGLGIDHEAAWYSLFAHTQYATRDFQQLGAAALERTPRQRSFAGVGFDLARFGNLQFAYGLQSFYDDRTVRTLGFTYSVTLGLYGNLGFFATRSDAVDGETTVALSWTLPLGVRNSVNTAVQRSATATGESLEAYATWQHDLPTDSGLGYRVSVSSSEEQDASIAWRGRAGMATLDYATRNGESATRLGATGGVALTAAGVLPGRHLDQSFAVVQVADYPGLTVFLDNQPVGRTDAHGRLLVDALRPYERNQIAIDPTQVPMDGALAQAAIDVTPAYRSGAVVQFPIARAHAATLRLVRSDGSAVPTGATATLHGRAFPVALDGLTYVEGLEDPTVIVVTWNGGRCVAPARPAGGDSIPDLGTVRCE
jgi:outer membrane usher protein